MTIKVHLKQTFSHCNSYSFIFLILQFAVYSLANQSNVSKIAFNCVEWKDSRKLNDYMIDLFARNQLTTGL